MYFFEFLNVLTCWCFSYFHLCKDPFVILLPVRHVLQLVLRNVWVGCTLVLSGKTWFVLFYDWLLSLIPHHHISWANTLPHTFLSSLKTHTITITVALSLCLSLIFFSLQEGRYMLGHKSGEAFLTIYKAIDGKKPTRSVYDLQTVHCGPPVIPNAKVPWVPLDPFHLMSFHKKYCRPPCTFPPRPPPQPKVFSIKY